MKPRLTGLFVAALLAEPLGSVADGTKTPAEEGASPPKIEQLSEHDFRLGEINFNKSTRNITFDATVNQVQDPIEYAIVHVTGKDHESLLTTRVSPYHLQVVLLLCGYQPGHGDLFTAAGTSEESPPPRDRDVLVTIAWKSPEGVLESNRIEDWILDLSTGRSMPPSSWAFTGSTIIDGSFQAEVEGSIVAIYLDEFALLNYPGAGNRDDEIWIPHAKKMPPLDHPERVTIVLPPQPAIEPK